MSGRNVSLTDHLSSFVDVQVENGRHQNASEVVREALRRYENDLSAERERVAAIRDVICGGREAIARGDFTIIAMPDDSAGLLSRLTRGTPKPGSSRRG
jgi:antitoxin ParD1/3/4